MSAANLLRSVSGCTQKTFMHSLDWEEGRKIISDAADEIDDLTKANQILQALIGNRDKEVDRLRKGIQDYLDGNYPHSRSYRPNACPHGLLWFNGDCDQCAEEHFKALLAPPSPAHSGPAEPIENKGGGQ